MKRPLSFYIAIVFALVIALNLAFAVFRLAEDFSSTKKLVDKELKIIASNLQSIRADDVQSQAFLQNLRDLFFESQSLVALLIEGPHGVEFAIEKSEGPLVYEHGEPYFVKSFSFIEKDLSFALPFTKSAGLNLYALVPRYDPVELNFIFKRIGILLSASLLVVLILLYIRKSQKGELRKNKKTEESAPLIALAEGIPSLSAELSEVVTEEKVPSFIPDSDTDKEMPSDLTLKTVQKSSSEEPTPLPPQESLPKTSPQGLFNPATGLGWEAYLPERLEAELQRSASFEQDLVLLLIEAQRPILAEAWAEICEAAVRFFSFRDLGFERGEMGMAIILPNMDLEHGIRMAEEFLRRHRVDGEEPYLKAVLSSRHGRIVDVARIMLEAKGALARVADEPETAVLGFRSDPERYREILREKS